MLLLMMMIMITTIMTSKWGSGVIKKLTGQFLFVNVMFRLSPLEVNLSIEFLIELMANTSKHQIGIAIMLIDFSSVQANHCNNVCMHL